MNSGPKQNSSLSNCDTVVLENSIVNKTEFELVKITALLLSTDCVQSEMLPKSFQSHFW